MEDRKRRASPVGGATGTAAQKRKLSSMTSAAASESAMAGAEDGTSVDAALGLEQGFLEVSFSSEGQDIRSCRIDVVEHRNIVFLIRRTSRRAPFTARCSPTSETGSGRPQRPKSSKQTGAGARRASRPSNTAGSVCVDTTRWPSWHLRLTGIWCSSSKNSRQLSARRLQRTSLKMLK